MRRRARSCAALCTLLLSAAASAAPGYFRFPAERGGTVVFTAEGDLWTVPLAGGTARRLTTHPAEESQAAISPDGRSVAFVAAYDGVPDVYVMPLAGGAPQRLTFDGGRAWVSGFSPDGAVVYATESVSGPSWRRMLRAVDPASGARRELPLADAWEATFDADGGLWFTRFGLHVSGDNARDYRGGAMAQLWRWDGKDGVEARRIAADAGANLTRPMWRDGRLHAVADVDGVANLWSMDATGGDRRALTRHRDFEVRGASMGDARIVYQHGADLRVFDLASGEDRAIPVVLASDFEQRRERFLKKPLAFAASVSFAPSGERVVLGARGRIALAGTGPLRRVEVALPADARARDPVLSVDGASVYAIVDQGAASEVWRFPADGSPGGAPLTREGTAHRWRLHPSPDGRWLVHDDRGGRLWITDLRAGTTRLLDESVHARDDAFQGLAWSPDGRWLALARPDTRRLLDQIVLLEADGTRKAVLTSDKYPSAAPAFSRDGRWLYFVSDRNYQPVPGGPWGDRNTGAFFDRRGKVYALALQAGNRFPFRARDELAPAKDAAGKGGGAGNGAPAAGGKDAKDGKADAPALPAVELEGLGARLHEVPLAAGNYAALAADAERLYLLERDAAPDARPVLKTLAIADAAPQPEVFSADVQSFFLSADAKKILLVRSGNDPQAPQAPGEMLVVDAGAKAPADVSKAQVRVADWNLAIDPVAEWRQMFDDAWRMHRVFSFDPAMRGVDWDAVRARFRPLVERVTDRAELDDLLAQMIAEVGLLHSQVRAGEFRADPEAVPAAALGAAYEDGPEGVRIARIWRTEAELPSERGPLQQPGVDAREGDRVLAVDGRPVRTAGDIAMALRQRAGQQVLLTLSRGSAPPHRTVVVPVALDREATLRYGDWVARTRDKVESGGDGRIGYLHLRAMGAGDMAHFVREFYAQYDRDGLVIDVRRNRGGNIDSWVIEKLLRRTWAFWQPPGTGPYWNMQQTFRGHLVVLADAFTYSDGETFAAGVKALGLGPVVGTRTAGAGIWLSDRNRLADNGIARIAEFGQFDREGRWLIEGRGVAPDIEVDNPPHATARGEDAQLDAALGLLAQRLREQPVTQPPAQAIPPRGTPGRDGSR
jgi:tricorn protease